jgi:hypothetical protein
LNILKHEGAHGTYADADVDERAASAVWDGSANAPRNSYVPIEKREMFARNTDKWVTDRMNGDARDAAVLREAYVVAEDGTKTYEKDELRKRLVGDLEIYKYKELTSEDMKEIFDFYQTYSADKYSIQEKENGEVTIEIDERSNAEFLTKDDSKLTTEEKIKKEVTLAMRDIIGGDVYYSFQMVTDELFKNKIGMSNMPDLTKDKKVDFIYVDKEIDNKRKDEYTYVYDVKFVLKDGDYTINSITDDVKYANTEKDASYMHDLVEHPKNLYVYYNTDNSYIVPQKYENSEKIDYSYSSIMIDYGLSTDAAPFSYYYKDNTFNINIDGNDKILIPVRQSEETDTLYYENLMYELKGNPLRLFYDDYDIYNRRFFILDNKSSVDDLFNKYKELDKK